MTVQTARKMTPKRTAKKAPRKSKVTGTGLAMDVYSGGKRCPVGKNLFDLKRQKRSG
jgi:hypothetical protein